MSTDTVKPTTFSQYDPDNNVVPKAYKKCQGDFRQGFTDLKASLLFMYTYLWFYWM